MASLIMRMWLLLAYDDTQRKLRRVGGEGQATLRLEASNGKRARILRGMAAFGCGNVTRQGSPVEVPGLAQIFPSHLRKNSDFA